MDIDYRPGDYRPGRKARASCADATARRHPHRAGSFGAVTKEQADG